MMKQRNAWEKTSPQGPSFRSAARGGTTQVGHGRPTGGWVSPCASHSQGHSSQPPSPAPRTNTGALERLIYPSIQVTVLWATAERLSSGFRERHACATVRGSTSSESSCDSRMLLCKLLKFVISRCLAGGLSACATGCHGFAAPALGGMTHPGPARGTIHLEARLELLDSPNC